MTWNYRVGYKSIKDEEIFEIYEVYYKDGFIDAWSLAGMSPHGETGHDLALDFALMAKAFELPVLNMDTLQAGVVPAPPRTNPDP